MNVENRGALVGMVLGDAYVASRKRGPNYTESLIKIKHCIEQVDYCRHKLTLVQKAVNGGYKAQLGFYDAKVNGKTFKQCQFQISHPYFSQLHGWAYPDGKFKITRRLLDMLTPQGIAIWYMDDGHARVNLDKDGYVSSCSTDIATCCSKEDAAIVIEFFQEEYGIEFRLFKVGQSGNENRSWCVRANTKESHEFAGIIYPHIVPSMLYKMKHVADLKTHECRAPVGECRMCGHTIYDNRRKWLCVKCYTRHSKIG